MNPEEKNRQHEILVEELRSLNEQASSIYEKAISGLQLTKDEQETLEIIHAEIDSVQEQIKNLPNEKD